MAKAKQGLVKADDGDKQAVKELLEIRKQLENDVEDSQQDIQDSLQEEFHQVWDDTIKPALEHLKSTADELLKRFSEYEEDFRGYLRDREPDVNIELLAEIYGDSLAAKSAKDDDEEAMFGKSETPEITKKLLADYKKAKEAGMGPQFLRAQGLNKRHISNWKKMLKLAAKNAEIMSDKP